MWGSLIADSGHKSDAMGLKRRHIERVVLAVIVLFGLYLRLTLLAGTTIDTPFRSDARQYTAYAYNLKQHGVYSNNFNAINNPDKTPAPDAFRSPGYPLFLYPFTNAKSMVRFAINVFYAQALLSAMTIAAVYVLSRIIIGGIGGLVAAFLTAASPHLINLNIYLLTETVFTFFLVSGIVVLILAVQTENKSALILSGLILAFATLVKPTLQYYLIFLIGFFFIQSGIKHRLSVCLLIVVPFTTVFSIWLIRNMITLGYPTDPSLAINTIHHGMYPHFMFNGDPRTFGFPYRFDPHSKEIARSMGSVLSATFNRFLTRPADHIVWFLSKPFYLFRWDMIQGIGTFIYPVQQTPYQTSVFFAVVYQTMRIIHPILILLSWIGALLCWLPEKWLKMDQAVVIPVRLLSLVYLYFVLVHVAGAPFPRYSIPLRPITYVLAMTPFFLFITGLMKKNDQHDAKRFEKDFGSHLCMKLINEGNDVLCIDNLK
ncbi:MAG: hypothetical protein CR984_03570 [Proteobacteria bacterium]|nr:MAG: hypothetical protein CR984_03570 [Pseudomonadota bacterium]PIE67008.1 MAG: hypothetical protein CSA23_06360 [Deltaproteobacteria bacterium]